MDNISIIQIKNFEECLPILNQFSDCLKSLRNATPEELAIYAKKFTQHGQVLVAKNSENENMGFVAYYANDIIEKKAYISMIAINSKFRQMHIGSNLIKQCFQDCMNKGMNSIFLEVSKHNDVAKTFYKKNDFIVVQECNDNKLLMKKVLYDKN